MVNPAILFSITDVLGHNFCVFQRTFSICLGEVTYFSDRNSQRIWFFWQEFSKNFYNSFDWLSVFCLCLKDHQNSLWILIRKENGITIFRTSGRILVEKEDSIGIFQGFQAGFTISNGLFWSEKLMVSPIGTSVWLCPQCLSRSTANIAFVISILGAKYLVYVSSRSVKLRELSFAQFVDLLWKVCLFFNQNIIVNFIIQKFA